MRYTIFLLGYVLITINTAYPIDNLTVIRATKEITLSGYTRNEKTVTVSSEISGKVRKVRYDIGQTISKKTFIEIDPTFVDFQIQNTKKSIAKSDITLKRLRSRISYLDKEFQRIEGLFKDNLATEAKRDAAQQELVQATLEFDTVDQEKAILVTKLNELIERKNRHNITAPQGWVVTEKMVEVGEVVQPGVPLAKVSNYKKLVVPLSVTGEELSAIQSLPDKFNAVLDGRPIKASINWVNPEFDENTRKLKIEVLIQNYIGSKRGGLKLNIPVSIQTEGILVPRAAVIDRYDNPTVTVRQTGEKVHLLVIGESDDYVAAAEDLRLLPGTELLPAEDPEKFQDR
jgi:RND family efflux transporter MFP subunit